LARCVGTISGRASYIAGPTALPVPIHVGPIQAAPGRLLFVVRSTVREQTVYCIGIMLGIVVPIGAIILLLIL
jgi:hypothetical protein